MFFSLVLPLGFVFFWFRKKDCNSISSGNISSNFVLPFHFAGPIAANCMLRPHNANHSLTGYRFHMENSDICFPFFSLSCCILLLNSFIGNGGDARIFTGSWSWEYAVIWTMSGQCQHNQSKWKHLVK